jgi:muconolactone D-isomerase
MLFKVEMTVVPPAHLAKADFDRLVGAEREMAQRLQREGKWRHLWRVVGRYANVSIFDVESPTELHDLLMGLPLFPYMRVEVTALCRHPSSIRDDDR